MLVRRLYIEQGPFSMFYLLLAVVLYAILTLNTLRPKQNGSHFADDTCCIFIHFSFKCVPMCPISNWSSLVLMVACH